MRVASAGDIAAKSSLAVIGGDLYAAMRFPATSYMRLTLKECLHFSDIYLANLMMPTKEMPDTLEVYHGAAAELTERLMCHRSRAYNARFSALRRHWKLIAKGWPSDL